MVYCGKPSRGCQMCRTRRIKVSCSYERPTRSPPPEADILSSGQCDETKPTCNQCAKARRDCPGYRDEFELIFRNETKATERRAQKSSKKGYLASSSGNTANEHPPASVGKLSPIAKALGSRNRETISPSLSIPTDQMASCHFLSNFILVPREGSTRGFMGYLLPLMKTEGPDSHLQHAFNACSLAHLGNRVKSTDGDILDKALSEYTKALAATHTALTDQESYKSDASLATVLLLGLYEVSRPGRRENMTGSRSSIARLTLPFPRSRTSRPRKGACSRGART